MSNQPLKCREAARRRRCWRRFFAALAAALMPHAKRRNAPPPEAPGFSPELLPPAPVPCAARWVQRYGDIE